MRGGEVRSSSLFSYIDLPARVGVVVLESGVCSSAVYGPMNLFPAKTLLGVVPSVS